HLLSLLAHPVQGSYDLRIVGCDLVSLLIVEAASEDKSPPVQVTGIVAQAQQITALVKRGGRVDCMSQFVQRSRRLAGVEPHFSEDIFAVDEELRVEGGG